MREFEFRAWNKHHKKMCSWENMGKEEFNNDDYIVMQFTGLTDRKGVKIFEGDMVLEGDMVFIGLQPHRHGNCCF